MLDGDGTLPEVNAWGRFFFITATSRFHFIYFKHTH
jgi:hypothetical protein